LSGCTWYSTNSVHLEHVSTCTHDTWYSKIYVHVRHRWYSVYLTHTWFSMRIMCACNTYMRMAIDSELHMVCHTCMWNTIWCVSRSKSIPIRIILTWYLKI